MATSQNTYSCLETDCKATFHHSWEADPDDWTQETVESMQRAAEIGWQIVSLPGKVRFYCPLHHNPNAPTR